MSAKLKIDIKQGVLEVDGSEEFVTKIYNDYKDRLSAIAPSQNTSHSGNGSRSSAPEILATENKKRSPVSRNKTGAPPTIVKELDLAPRNGQPGLKDFAAPYNPGSAKEWNLLFLYYMVKNERANPVSQDHIYSCYKAMGVRPPEAFSQSMFDTASKKGWIDSKSLSDIKLTIAGENFMDHDFPKKEPAHSK
jgi:hypothetical protein